MVAIVEEAAPIAAVTVAGIATDRVADEAAT
jgi:hypothetical protein